MRIDSHQHFWEYSPQRDTWIDSSMTVIKRNFYPKDALPLLQQHAIDGCIAVQADQSEEETVFLLQLAKENPVVKGVVGWVDLCDENVEERLRYFSQNKLFKGVRHIAQAEPDDFLLRADFQNGIGKLEQFKLTYDLLIVPTQLCAAIRLVNKFPNQKFILNHIAKPNIKDKKIVVWAQQIKELAENPKVYCKVSGLVTEAAWFQWEKSDFIPYLDIIFKAFGTDRLLYGSDWPVCLLSSSYTQTIDILESYINDYSHKEQERIMGKNAGKVYNL